MSIDLGLKEGKKVASNVLDKLGLDDNVKK
jgi:hypothetical protein